MAETRLSASLQGGPDPRIIGNQTRMDITLRCGCEALLQDFKGQFSFFNFIPAGIEDSNKLSYNSSTFILHHLFSINIVGIYLLILWAWPRNMD